MQQGEKSAWLASDSETRSRLLALGGEIPGKLLEVLISFCGYSSRNTTAETKEYKDILYIPRYVSAGAHGFARVSEIFQCLIQIIR